jgi:hypothetical protein
MQMVNTGANCGSTCLPVTEVSADRALSSFVKSRDKEVRQRGFDSLDVRNGSITSERVSAQRRVHFAPLNGHPTRECLDDHHGSWNHGDPDHRPDDGSLGLWQKQRAIPFLKPARRG